MKYSEGYLLDDRYLFERFIGSGTFGEVWVAIDKAADIEVAIKVYVSLDEEGLQEFKKEFQISFELNQTNLLHAYYLGVNTEDMRPYLVMPYCPDGSVSKKAGEMSEEEIWCFIRDVASGLAYLHSQNPPIIHQDIKPANILILKNGDFVVTDFGVSKQLRATLRKSAKSLNSAGAISYMGPERFSKQYQAVKASDIWSLGVSIFELATNELPFCGMGGSLQKQGAEMPELPDDFSPMLNMVCQSCMAKQPWDRPTAMQLVDFASKILNGDCPRPSWKIEEQADTQMPPTQQSIDFRQTMRHIPKEQLEPQSVQNEISAPSSQLASIMPNFKATVVANDQTVPIGMTPVAPPVPSSQENPFGGSDDETKEEKFSPWIWGVVAIAGLMSGILLNYFI